MADRELIRRIRAVRGCLERLYPEAGCTLDHLNPLQLLVSTILSAQCKDERVNGVTPALFRRCRTAADFARMPLAELESMIRSLGFFRVKARSIRNSCARIVSIHGGEVPRTLDELTALPGVGRKTANVILSNAFGINQGIAVDTHVGRLSLRLGLSRENDPAGVERDLMTMVPREEWAVISHRLISHGRSVCRARHPLCYECMLAPKCPSAKKPKNLGFRRRGGRGAVKRASGGL